MIENVGLVLEGGGMRAVYTAGVLESFLENDIYFPYVIGVSAGAANAASYLSKQKGRNHIVNIDYVTDSRYLSWRNFLKNREFFGMDFIFGEIPNKLVPYDFDTFYQSNGEFVVGTTDCYTGEPVYFSKQDYANDLLTVIRASSSLPFIASEIAFKEKLLLDGGISDPIPIKKAQHDGFQKNVVVLTRNEGYLKKPSRFQFLVKRKYPNYRGLQTAMQQRYLIYNKTIHYLEELEKQGKVLIIRPTEPIEVGRMERDPEKLSRLYHSGYQDGKCYLDKIKNFS